MIRNENSDLLSILRYGKEIRIEGSYIYWKFASVDYYRYLAPFEYERYLHLLEKYI